MLRPVLVVLSCLGSLLLPVLSAAASDLKTANAWIELPILREAPSAYLVLRNQSPEKRTLIGGSCKGCDDVEIHRAVLKDGAMASEVLEGWEIPAGADVAFAPRGLSLSLVGLENLSAGDSIAIELEFADGEKLGFEAVVRDE